MAAKKSSGHAPLVSTVAGKRVVGRATAGTKREIAPKLPKVAQKTLTAPPRTPGGKATPGGDHGALHRRDHPPMPVARKPAAARAPAKKH